MKKRRGKVKIIAICAIIMSLVILAQKILQMQVDVKNDTYSATSIVNKSGVTKDSSAKEIAYDMGMGWNYGGKFANFSGLKKDKYQLQVTYQSNPYTQWDANASYPYFNATTGKVSLSWKLSSLKSTGPVGAFTVKIVNQQITNSGNTKVKYRIDNTKLILANGNEVEVGGEGIYSSAITTDHATEKQNIDLTNIDGITDTADLANATFTIEVSLIDYAVQQTTTTYSELNTSIFDAVKSKGFNTVRLPVTYVDHMDADGNIDEEYLEKVKEVVDAIVSRNMYCILNVQHDAGNLGWLSVGYIDEHKAKFQNMWKQIATKFSSYDYHLIYEGINEPLNFLQSSIWDVYDTAKIPAESINNVNKLNQYFVDAVRSVQGNENRFLMVSSYANKEFAYTTTYNDGAKFTLPTDSANDKLMIDVHVYTSDTNDMDWRLNLLKNSGYAVYIGEFGLYSSEIATKGSSQITLVEKAAKKGIKSAIWDDGGSMAILKASTVTPENYNTDEIWNGNDTNFIKNLITASESERTEETTKTPVTEVKLNKEQTTIKEGETETLTATVMPENATNKNITWSSNNEEVATVENGVVTAKKEGTAIITVTTEDGNKQASCNVTVEKKATDPAPDPDPDPDPDSEPTKTPVTEVKLNKEQTTIKEGETETLTATVMPENATNKNITWSSNNEEVATVENGVVTAKKEGTAIITVTTEDGNKQASCNVTVEKNKTEEDNKKDDKTEEDNKKDDKTEEDNKKDDKTEEDNKKDDKTDQDNKKDQNNESSVDESNKSKIDKEEDMTKKAGQEEKESLSDKILPKTGKSYSIVILIIIVVIVLVYSKIRYERLKDIK